MTATLGLNPGARRAITVLMAGRNAERAAKVKAALEAKGAKVVFVPGDLTKLEDVRKIIPACEAAFGRIDALVNAAAITDRGTIWETSEARYDEIMDANVKAPFFLMQDALKLMRKTKVSGAIVNILSMSGHGGQDFLTAYCTSKGALAVLKGNLAPDGCVIKPSACEPRFLKHTGPALVFDDYPSMKKAIDDPGLDVTADHVLILRNAGPQGGPGMPEWGMLPIPTKLVKQGVRDMVRLSDARMSGTSYGACILHVAPESFIGGPLALVRNGDRITLDVAARTINLDVSEAELAKRRAEWKPPERRFERGYGWMFSRHIKQANEGCDFDFLETGFGAPVDEPSIY